MLWAELLQIVFTPGSPSIWNLEQDVSVNYNTLASQDTGWWVNGAFCYIGRIVDQKGVKEIILAWEILYKKYLDLTPPMWFISGTAEDICKYRRIIKQYVPDLETYEKQAQNILVGIFICRGNFQCVTQMQCVDYAFCF